MKRLILGGIRSGKSGHALKLLMSGPAPRTAIVSGRPLDLSFRARILDHRAARSPEVEVREVDLGLPEALLDCAEGGVLVDSLDFWMYSWLCSERSPLEAAERLAKAVMDVKAREVILVSCEIGLGPLPADREPRTFADALGALNRAVARACDETYLVVAGRALKFD